MSSNITTSYRTPTKPQPKATVRRLRDSGLSIALTGTSFGVSSSTICTISPSSGTTTTAACTGWSDYGTSVTAPSAASGASTDIQWKLYGVSSYTPTTGGSTEAAFTYYKQVGNKYEITDENSGTSFDSGLTALTITGTVGGTGGITLCMITTSSAASPAVCSANPAYSDYNTAVNGFTNPLGGAGTNIRWEASATCSFTPTSGGNTENCNYWKQWTNGFKYSVTDGGSPTAPTLSCNEYGVTATLTLTTSSQAFYCDNNAVATATNPTTGSTLSERWSDNAQSFTITTGGATDNFAYYNQYGFTLSYSVSGGGSGYSAPTLTSTQFGASYTPTLTTTATAYWLDSGQVWSVTNPLTGSGTTERWQSTQTTSGTVSSSSPTTAGGSLVFAYYNQYKQTLSYSVVDGGTPTSPTASGQQYGSAYAPSLTTTATAYWFDASETITISTPTNGASERWSPSPASISATISNTQVFSMYNQYPQTLSYNVNYGGSGYSAPATIGGLELGSAYTPTLTTTATGYWFDATGTLTFTNPLTGSGSTEQWTDNSVSVPLASSNTQVIQYYNQWAVTFSVSISGAGTITLNGNAVTLGVATWVNGGGTNTIVVTANSGHHLASTIWTKTGTISFGSTTSATTTVTVSSTGTIQAHFSS